MKELIEVLEAFLDQANEQQKKLGTCERRKESLSYYEGKKAGLELAIFKARGLQRPERSAE